MCVIGGFIVRCVKWRTQKPKLPVAYLIDDQRFLFHSSGSRQKHLPVFQSKSFLNLLSDGMIKVSNGGDSRGFRNDPEQFVKDMTLVQCRQLYRFLSQILQKYRRNVPDLCTGQICHFEGGNGRFLWRVCMSLPNFTCVTPRVKEFLLFREFIRFILRYLLLCLYRHFCIFLPVNYYATTVMFTSHILSDKCLLYSGKCTKKWCKLILITATYFGVSRYTEL